MCYAYAILCYLFYYPLYDDTINLELRIAKHCVQITQCLKRLRRNFVHKNKSDEDASPCNTALNAKKQLNINHL